MLPPLRPSILDLRGSDGESAQRGDPAATDGRAKTRSQLRRPASDYSVGEDVVESTVPRYPEPAGRCPPDRPPAEHPESALLSGERGISSIKEMRSEGRRCFFSMRRGSTLTARSDQAFPDIDPQTIGPTSLDRDFPLTRGRSGLDRQATGLNPRAREEPTSIARASQVVSWVAGHLPINRSAYVDC